MDGIKMIPALRLEKYNPNTSDLCRTCLSTQDLHPIFGRSGFRNRSRKLKRGTGLKILKNDNLSQFICSTCLSHIDFIIQFRNKSKQAEETLLRMEALKKIKSEPDHEMQTIEAYPFLEIEILGEEHKDNQTQYIKTEHSYNLTLSDSTPIEDPISCKIAPVKEPSCGQEACSQTTEYEGTLDIEVCENNAINNDIHKPNSEDKVKLNKKAESYNIHRHNSQEEVKLLNKPENNYIQKHNGQEEDKINNKPSLIKECLSLVNAVETLISNNDIVIKKNQSKLKSKENTDSNGNSKKIIELRGLNGVIIKTSTKIYKHNIISMNTAQTNDNKDFLDNTETISNLKKIDSGNEIQQLGPKSTITTSLKNNKNNDGKVTRRVRKYYYKRTSLANNINQKRTDQKTSDTCSKSTDQKAIPLNQNLESVKEFISKKDSLTTDSENNIHKCKYCDKTFVIYGTYRQHERSHVQYLICEFCGKKWNTRHHLLKHKRAHHGLEKIFKCCYCELSFSGKELLQVHERRHQNIKPYICDSCGAAFGSRKILIQHVGIHQPPTLQCPYCPKKLKSKILLSNHKAYKHRNQNYSHICPVCHKEFRSNKSVHRHLQRIHKLPPGEHPKIERRVKLPVIKPLEIT